MSKLLEFLNTYGIYLDDSAPTVIKLSLYFLILSLILLFNYVNICIYLLSIYIVSHDKLLKKIPEKYKYIHKIINYYKNIRVFYILIEFVFLYICLGLMISLSYGLVSYYIHFS